MVVVPVDRPGSLLAFAFQYMAHRLAGRDHFVEPRERSFAVVLRQRSVLDKVADQCLDLVIREIAAGHAVPVSIVFSFDQSAAPTGHIFRWSKGVQQGGAALCFWAAIGTFVSARVS
jgi:hypothetical protein